MKMRRWIPRAVAFALSASVSVTTWAKDPDPDSEADNYADLWLRLDADRVGVQAWVGGTTPLGPVELASNLVVTQTYPGVKSPLEGAVVAQSGNDYRAPAVRLELGPAFASGGFFFLPKLGVGYDFERKKAVPLVPQLQSIIQAGPAYFESWLQLYFYDVFDDGAQDSFYTRELLLVALNNHWAFGVQAELTAAIRNSPGQTVRGLPVGAVANFSPRELVTFGLFVGVETQSVARNSEHDYLTGRFTTTWVF